MEREFFCVTRENDIVYDVTYHQFVENATLLSAWTKEQDAVIGHRAQVGLLGSSSHHYLAVMLGVMANGNTVGSSGCPA